MQSTTKRIAFSLLAGAALFTLTVSAQATMYSSSAYAWSSTLQGNDINFEFGPIAETQGQGDNGYTDEQQSSTLEWGNKNSLHLDADELNSTSSSDGHSASAHVFTDDIELHPFHDFKLSTDEIEISIGSDGDINLTQIKDIKIKYAGDEVTLYDPDVGDNKPDPNTAISDIRGLSQILAGTGISGIFNEQGETGNGSAFVNVLHLWFDNFSADDLNGELIIGHAQVDPFAGDIAGGGNNGNDGGSNNSGNTTTVPAPSGFASFLLLAFALGGLAMTRSRRRDLSRRSAV